MPTFRGVLLLDLKIHFWWLEIAFWSFLYHRKSIPSQCGSIPAANPGQFCFTVDLITSYEQEDKTAQHMEENRKGSDL